MKTPTLLLIAISLADYAQAQDMKEVAYPYTESYDGLPELHQAIVDDDEQKIVELIGQGADINQLDSRMGNSPIHIAAQSDNPRIIEMLIEKGAFVNVVTPRSGLTPLMVAVWHKKPENVKALLKAEDISVYARSPFGGSTARDWIGGWDKDPSENDVRRNTELHSLLDDFEKELKAKAADQKIYQVVVSGQLTEKEKEEKVRALIEGKEPVNTESMVMARGNDIHSPLLVAARDNYIGIVEMLLDAGAEIGQRGRMMNAIAFHKSAYNGNLEVIKLLVDHEDASKYIDDQGFNNGFTPLHDAIWHGHTESAKLLIDAGARLDLISHGGDTPLSFAISLGYDDIAALIESALEANANRN